MGGGATFGGPWRGSGRSGRYSGIRAQGSNEICNELITMDVPKKGTRALLAHSCRVDFRWLAFQQGPSVNRRRALLLLLGAHAASVVASSLMLCLGFILGLRVRIGLRYATVVLAIAFWWVFPERRLGGSGGGAPRTSLCCFRWILCSLCWPSVGRLFGLHSGDVFPE
ncbi:hypothetical protein Taro_025630 [Colocasia esculenta]|uniref:Uncharacterized protein n=1 Tax=Colocasia esculenta TaxID=4460 RepID=A0A843VI64_COLES|nr:hypothetical protein [Colocasia esculenta]